MSRKQGPHLLMGMRPPANAAGRRLCDGGIATTVKEAVP
jgi:hypothetical protein